MDKLIFEKGDKSFLRKKWENTLIETIKSKIPNIYYKNNQVIVLDSEEAIKNFFFEGNEDVISNKRFIILLVPLNNFVDLISFFDKIDKLLHEDCKLILNYFNGSWKYVFSLFSILGLIKNFDKSLFFSRKKLNIFLNCTNYEISRVLKEISIPFKIPFLTKFLTILINLFPFLAFFSFSNVFYLRKKTKQLRTNKMMSIIIPCKNEQYNIKKIVENAKYDLVFPFELVFVDDQSNDLTKKMIEQEIQKNPKLKIKVFDGNGKGKSRAVDVGVKNAEGYFCAILDADLTVKIKDMNLFYSSISLGNGDVINGSRLIYRLEKNSMRFLNYLGNKFFSLLISFIISTNVSDTLCGTKCFRRKDWEIFEDFRKNNTLDDIWGDFNILFSSSFYGFKLIDLPVRYYERLSGETKMKKRFYYFINMLKLCTKALIVFKFKLK
ncbi:glycosyltransferase family 2 protein [Candidatus Pelagibacter sp.]|nr:glycosyltransferase family 2 protein [Candidatus Pelagibacter sp.]